MLLQVYLTTCTVLYCTVLYCTVLLQVYLTTGLFVIVSWISFIVPPEVVPGNTSS